MRGWRAGVLGAALVVGGASACGDSGRPCGERAALVATCYADGVDFEGCPCEPTTPVALVCSPDAEISCYPGPPATENVGACAAGSQRCFADGAGMTPCDGAVVPRMNVCGTSEDLSCGLQEACVHDHAWAHDFGVDDSPNVATHAGVDASGRVYVLAGDVGAPGVASPTGTALFGFDAGGRKTFIRDAPGYDMSVIDSGGAAMLSSAPPPCAGVEPSPGDYVASYDATGSCRWSAKLTGGGRGMRRIAADPQGDVIVADTSTGTVQKLRAADGSFAWRVQGTGATLGSVGTDAASNVYVLGSFTSSVDFGTGPVGAGTTGIFVAKFAPDGELVYLRSFVAPSVTMAVARDGEVALAGFVPKGSSIAFDGAGFAPKGRSALYFARLDAGGHTRTLRRLDVDSTQILVAVAPDGATVFSTVTGAGFSFAGVSTALSKGDVELLVGRLTAEDGEPTWGMTYGAGAGVSVASLAVAPTGAPVLAGAFSIELDLASGPLLNLDATGLGFVAKLAP